MKLPFKKSAKVDPAEKKPDAKKDKKNLGPRTQKGLVAGLRNEDELYNPTKQEAVPFPAQLKVTPGEVEWDSTTKANLKREDPRELQLQELRQKHLPLPNDTNPEGETQLRYAGDQTIMDLLLGSNKRPVEFVEQKAVKKDPYLRQRPMPFVPNIRSCFDPHRTDLTVRERTKEHYNFRRTHSIFAFVGFSFALLGVDQTARSTDQSGGFTPSPIAILCEALGSVFAILLVMTIYKYYRFVGHYQNEHRHFLRTKLGRWFWMEIFIALIHPIAFVTSAPFEMPLPKFWAKDAIPEAYGLTVKHAMDVPVMLFMTLRLYFLFQYLHVPTMLVYTSLSHEAKGNNVDILSPAFLSMYYLENNAATLIGSAFTFLVLWFSFLFRTAERSLDLNLRFQDAVWYMTLNVLGVHPGEMFCKTDMGRFCVFVALVLRTLLFMVALATVQVKMVPTINQARVLRHCRRMKVEYEFVRAAGRMITLWWHLNRKMSMVEEHKAMKLEQVYFLEVARWHRARKQYHAESIHEEMRAQAEERHAIEQRNEMYSLQLKFADWLVAISKKLLVFQHELVAKIRVTLSDDVRERFEERLDLAGKEALNRFSEIEKRLGDIDVHMEHQEKILAQLANKFGVVEKDRGAKVRREATLDLGSELAAFQQLHGAS